MATVTAAKLALSYNKNSKSTIHLQGTDLESGVTKVTAQHPPTGTPLYSWEGKVKKHGKKKDIAEADLTQLKEAKKGQKETTGDISVTVGTTTITVKDVVIYEE
jgi:hypothetical protein